MPQLEIVYVCNKSKLACVCITLSRWTQLCTVLCIIVVEYERRVSLVKWFRATTTSLTRSRVRTILLFVGCHTNNNNNNNDNNIDIITISIIIVTTSLCIFLFSSTDRLKSPLEASFSSTCTEIRNYIQGTSCILSYTHWWFLFQLLKCAMCIAILFGYCNNIALFFPFHKESISDKFIKMMSNCRIGRYIYAIQFHRLCKVLSCAT